MKEWEADVQHSLVLLNFSMRDDELFSDHHQSFTTFFYGASWLDWCERELDETTISKMTLQCCWCFFDCVYYFNSVFVLCFTIYLSVRLSHGEEFCWNPLFSPLSTAFPFSNCHYFYIPWLPINSSKRKSLFESQSLSLVLLRKWFILGARVHLFPTKNCQGIEGLSRVKVPGVKGLIASGLNSVVQHSKCFVESGSFTD